MFSLIMSFLLLGQPVDSPLKLVPQVDVNRYAGKWYEIASMPIKWQKNCDCTTAEYKLQSDGKIAVYNSCYDRKKKKRVDTEGKASAVDGTGNAHLKVEFFHLFKGDYQIIELDENYQYAMVGTADRKYLWILSRAPIMDEPTAKRLIAQAARQGFVTARLKFTKQSCYNK